jgi:hypothetical protein
MSIGTIPPVTPVAQGEPEHKQAEGGKHETLTGQPTRRERSFARAVHTFRPVKQRMPRREKAWTRSSEPQALSGGSVSPRQPPLHHIPLCRTVHGPAGRVAARSGPVPTVIIDVGFAPGADLATAVGPRAG